MWGSGGGCGVEEKTSLLAGLGSTGALEGEPREHPLKLFLLCHCVLEGEGKATGRRCGVLSAFSK